MCCGSNLVSNPFVAVVSSNSRPSTLLLLSQTLQLFLVPYKSIW
jgi:hypothetical protein